MSEKSEKNESDASDGLKKEEEGKESFSGGRYNGYKEPEVGC